MNETQLSKRLEIVGAQVPAGSRLADIGSDHAYLPIALMLAGKISHAIAGEVVQGPFQSAQNQVAKNNLSKKIEVRLADGLEAITLADEIDAITIAGMGGSLIRDILENGRQKGRLSGKEYLVLQPNVGERNVREWLADHSYQIDFETVLAEKGKIYEVIAAKKSDMPVTYTEEELMFGPLLLQNPTSVFQQKWQRELHQREQVWTQLQTAKTPPSEKLTQIRREIEKIREVLQHD